MPDFNFNFLLVSFAICLAAGTLWKILKNLNEQRRTSEQVAQKQEDEHTQKNTLFQIKTQLEDLTANCPANPLTAYFHARRLKNSLTDGTMSVDGFLDFQDKEYYRSVCVLADNLETTLRSRLGEADLLEIKKYEWFKSIVDDVEALVFLERSSQGQHHALKQHGWPFLPAEGLPSFLLVELDDEIKHFKANLRKKEFEPDDYHAPGQLEKMYQTIKSEMQQFESKYLSKTPIQQKTVGAGQFPKTENPYEKWVREQPKGGSLSD